MSDENSPAKPEPDDPAPVLTADRAAARRELAAPQREHQVDSAGRLRAIVLGANDGLVSFCSAC